MQSHSQSTRQSGRRRRGAMIVAVLALLMLILVMVAFSVDVAFMQLARTELKAATDAAAKAGAAALSRSDGDPKEARQEARRIANLNMVSGKPLKLVNADIEVGRSVKNSDGTWSFKKNLTPYTSVRVRGSKELNSASGPVNLFFGGVLGSRNFTPVMHSSASHFKQEIVLALDRSGSMAWDLSGVDWRFPSTVTGKNQEKQPPDPNSSRWGVLTKAVNAFLQELALSPVPPKLGLVTWASDMPEGTVEGLDLNAADVDVKLGYDLSAIEKAVKKRASKPIMGATNMSAGLTEALGLITGKDSSLSANKTIVLMTDGLWNQGGNPLNVATQAAAAGIVVHTITFLPKTNQPEMKQLAEITGGQHFHAENAADLMKIFQQLAMSLPVALIE